MTAIKSLGAQPLTAVRMDRTRRTVKLRCWSLWNRAVAVRKRPCSQLTLAYNLETQSSAGRLTKSRFQPKQNQRMSPCRVASRDEAVRRLFDDLPGTLMNEHQRSSARKPRGLTQMTPNVKGGHLRVVDLWWTWSGSNRRPLPCHGSGKHV